MSIEDQTWGNGNSSRLLDNLGSIVLQNGEWKGP